MTKKEARGGSPEPSRPIERANTPPEARANTPPDCERKPGLPPRAVVLKFSQLDIRDSLKYEDVAEK